MCVCLGRMNMLTVSPEGAKLHASEKSEIQYLYFLKK